MSEIVLLWNNWFNLKTKIIKNINKRKKKGWINTKIENSSLNYCLRWILLIDMANEIMLLIGNCGWSLFWLISSKSQGVSWFRFFFLYFAIDLCPLVFSFPFWRSFFFSSSWYFKISDCKFCLLWTTNLCDLVNFLFELLLTK